MIRFTLQGNGNRQVYLNPNHVASVHPGDNGSIIHMLDDTVWNVTSNGRDVVEYIEAQK